MDDTITDLVPVWVDTINYNFGTNVKHSDITEWDIASFFTDLKEIDVFGVLDDEELWKSVMPKPYAPEMLQCLIQDGHKIKIVTASSYKTVEPKAEHVLFKYFPFLTWDDVIITSEKQMIHGNFLIDDYPENLIGGDYYGILMDAPHNRNFDGKPHKITRVRDWHEIYRVITSYLTWCVA